MRVRRDTLSLGPVVALLAFATLGAAEPRALVARVAWTDGGRVYLTAPDSIALAPDDRLTFVDRGKTRATAVVVRLLDRDLALARLASGSLAKVKRLERLAILAEPFERGPLVEPAIAAPSPAPVPTVPLPPPPIPLPTLRVGLPASARGNLLFSCPRAGVRAPAGWSDSAVARGRLLARDPRAAPGAPWPDTILVRLFEDAADQEIALERGEIDVAVFWPGELSRHLRDHPRWRGFASAGWAAFVGAVGLAAADTAALAGLDAELFRGDLIPLPAASAPGPAEGAARFEVDTRLPGRAAIERRLNRGRAAAARRVQLRLVDAAGDGDAPRPLYGIRFPVLAGEAWRDRVQAIGPRAVLDLMDCRP